MASPIDMPHLSMDQVLETFERMEQADEQAKREEARETRCNIKTRAMRPPLKSTFKVQIVHGVIVSYDFGKERVRYTEEYFEDHYSIYYKACIKFASETGADMTTLLAAVLQDPVKRNQQKRWDMYHKLALKCPGPWA
jgi:hypothetical protein